MEPRRKVVRGHFGGVPKPEPFDWRQVDTGLRPDPGPNIYRSGFEQKLAFTITDTCPACKQQPLVVKLRRGTTEFVSCYDYKPPPEGCGFGTEFIPALTGAFTNWWAYVKSLEDENERLNHALARSKAKLVPFDDDYDAYLDEKFNLWLARKHGGTDSP